MQTSYAWDPATFVADVAEDDILGVEAPIWSETLETMQDVEQMAFPRLLSIAEIGWSPMAGARLGGIPPAAGRRMARGWTRWG